ncbi:MAG: ABC transporter ATP-binding protein [Chloroflexi bacterium]|nr:MAG: ABC transporter ATP-binding protein [Chloroflexota bacterium]
MSIPAIEIQGVSKAFRRREREAGAPWWRRDWKDKVALHELDLIVQPGGVTGILGPNGSGKSTLIRILGTLLTPDTGTARVFGWDVVKEALQVRRHVNRVSVELLGLPLDVIDQPMKQLSRGQQQKVAIARSFLTAPSLLLMDEPTTGLDPRSKKEVQTVLETLRAEREITVLVCTHDMNEAEALCERVLMMDGGRVLADGRPAELCRIHGGATLEGVFMHLTGKTLEAEEPEEVAP